MLVIGLVGGIACGKSFVAECFAELGAKILDADKIGHEVLEQSDVISEIQIAWPNVVLADGQIDRKSLAQIVFQSDGVSMQLDRLESITHPQIGKLIRQRLLEFKRQTCVAAVLDAPVMIKAGWHSVCDKLVFIEADLKTRIERANSRGWDVGELSRRESFQVSIEEKRRLSTDILDNSGSKNETQLQVDRLWAEWKLPRA